MVDETTPFRTEGTAVQATRVSAERALWEASRDGLSVTAFRPHYILGVHSTATWSTLLARRMSKGEYLLPGDGSASWAYVHVENLVDAVIAALDTDRSVGQAYNIVDGHTTGQEYTDRFRSWLGIASLPTRPEPKPWRGRLSGAKAVRDLGYAPRISFEEALTETERYLRACGMTAG